MSDIPPHQLPKDTGWIEVIAGCMFSGKTEELIRRLRRAQIAKQKVKKANPFDEIRSTTYNQVDKSNPRNEMEI